MRDRKHLFIMVFLAFLGVASICGCKSEVGRKVERTNAYYDLKGLLDRQLVLLDSINPTAEKITVIDGNTQKQSIQLDSAGWKSEMQIFYSADINEPILKDAYEKTEEITDSLKVVNYEAKNGKNTEIERLTVFYNVKEDEPFRIAAVFKEKNALYDSKRLLQLFINNQTKPALLTGYEIEGLQKMLMKDTVFYKIVLNNEFAMQ